VHGCILLCDKIFTYNKKSDIKSRIQNIGFWNNYTREQEKEMELSPQLLLENAVVPQIDSIAVAINKTRGICKEMALAKEADERLMPLYQAEVAHAHSIGKQVIAGAGGILNLHFAPVTLDILKISDDDWRYNFLHEPGTNCDSQATWVLAGQASLMGRTLQVRGIDAAGVAVVTVTDPRITPYSMLYFRKLWREQSTLIDGLFTIPVLHAKSGPSNLGFSASFAVSEHFASRDILWQLACCNAAIVGGWGLDIWKPRFLKKLSEFFQSLNKPGLVQQFEGCSLPLTREAKIAICEAADLAQEEEKQFLGKWGNQTFTELLYISAPVIPATLYVEYSANYRPRARWEKVVERVNIKRDALRTLMFVPDELPLLDQMLAKKLSREFLEVASTNLRGKKDTWREVLKVAMDYEATRREHLLRLSRK